MTTGPTSPADPTDPTSQESVVAAAAAEERRTPLSDSEAADLADRYDRMMRLAALFDDSGAQMRERAALGADVVSDPAFTESEPLSPATWAQAEEDVRAATTGKNGLLTRSIELDADALVLRATVLTYRWIDELQSAAYKTLGSIAGRAIGYLAPEVALGGAIVSAGLIETDALDRDGVAAYLDELAGSNPELMDHVTSGGGGLLDGLRMRSLLTAGVLSGDHGRLAGQGGLRAIGVAPFSTRYDAALRDVAGGLVEAAQAHAEVISDGADPTRPRNLTDLLTALAATESSVVVRRVGESRYVAYLPGPDGGSGRRLRLVGGDQSSYAAHVVRSIERAVAGDEAARVMLVGSAQGGVAAAEVAAGATSSRFVVDQVVTAGAPSAHVPRIPDPTRVLSLEDRADPIALLGSLIGSGGAGNRVTVVYDGGRDGYVEGGRAADGATHPALVQEIDRLVELGYLAG
ncbi:hypothetical protein [Nocardioides sp.]|uniref:hypothetical protein n=1 Tax=Nocardioides sp. TaxID=35761 RepID=UPI002720ED22|nr:hypothetical protein [Nocardioides sp.]MDO9457868.1 hypothetical protein [Nocardioides sp.]